MQHTKSNKHVNASIEAINTGITVIESGHTHSIRSGVATSDYNYAARRAAHMMTCVSIQLRSISSSFYIISDIARLDGVRLAYIRVDKLEANAL